MSLHDFPTTAMGQSVRQVVARFTTDAVQMNYARDATCPACGAASVVIMQAATSLVIHPCSTSTCRLSTADIMAAVGLTASDLQVVAAPDPPPPDAADLPRVGDWQSDARAVDRFVTEHGHDVRFDHRRGRWFLWTGQYWKLDDDGAIYGLVDQFVKRWQHAAIDDAISERDRIWTFTKHLEKYDGVKGFLALCQSRRPMADVGDQWNAMPWLLGCPNGVVDLTTGLLRPGQPSDRITQVTAVPYDAAASCPRWERFVAEIFNDDAGVVDFVHRAVGYSLTGDVSEQKLFLLHGKGGNGKSTFLDTLGRVFGDHAVAAPFTTFELKTRSQIPNDLAQLVGRRFVTASETGDGTRLNEARLKAITGDGTLSARFLHGELFEFHPVCKLWLAANHRPVVRDDSEGFWRRMLLIPFQRTFALDMTLASTLAAEAVGILRWAVAGCLRWQTTSLETKPAGIVQAVADYKSDSDLLAPFLAACVVADPTQSVRAEAVHKAYSTWCDQQAISRADRLGSRTFGELIRDRFERYENKHGRWYRVRLLAAVDVDPELPLT